MAARLFEPLSIRGVTLRNRIVVSPMCQYSSNEGFANDWHLVHLGSRAVGGAGLVFTEATAVEERGRITHQDLGIYRDEHVEFLSRIVSFVQSQGAVAGMQIAHAGRKASAALPWEGGAPLTQEQGAWTTVAPSALPFGNFATPKALNEKEISELVAAYGTATKRALDAGFKVLEIHAAHGYLLNEFLSPLANTRSDQYGGSFENRTKIVHEIVKIVRRHWPEQNPLFIRISATDWMDGGWDIEQSIKLARIVKDLGVDVVDCSSGGIVPDAKIPAGPGYQVPFAAQIRQEAKILIGAVGIITSPIQAEQILRTGQADLVILAREFLRDPYWPRRAAKELGYELKPPQQYLRAASY